VDDLETNIGTIASLAQAQSARSGAAGEKNAAFESLLDAAHQVAGATRAGAVVNKDAELAARVDDSRTDLGRGRAGEVVARCRNVWSAANDNVDVLGAFGVTAGKLTTLKKKIDDYETTQPRPRQDRANTRAATRTLPDLFDAADEILNDCLDGLMAQFKNGDAEFYNESFAARRIVNAPGVRRANGTTSTPAPAPTPTPVPV